MTIKRSALREETIRLLQDCGDEEFLDFCYHRILGRAPDETGRSIYLSQLRQGCDRTELLLDFISSDEHQSMVSSPFVHFATPGHFYSPLPCPSDIVADYDRTISRPLDPQFVPLFEQSQLELLNQLAVYQVDVPFKDEPCNGLRYGFKNDQFVNGDAVTLFAMLRHFRPRHLVEVGSGYSSAVILDTNEYFLDGELAMTFIEPFPERLHLIMKAEDKRSCRILNTPVQNVERSEFMCLGENDVMFIDCSHVGKFNSDLLYLLFEVLPYLARGVIVHVHDIFWPFEYPRTWLDEGRAWNEAYFLRAFLHGNSSFEVIFFNDFLSQSHQEALFEAMPLSRSNAGCGIWLRKAV